MTATTTGATSRPSTSRLRPWKGRWLMVVAIIHTAAAGFWFGPILGQLWAAGLLDSVGQDPLRGAVAWFTLFGLMLFAFALAVHELECRAPGQAQPRLAIALLLLVGLGVLLMPASGFWLAIPPALALGRGTTGAA